MTNLVEDLNYLKEFAYSFSIELNPHAGFHETIADQLTDVDDSDEDWISREQREQAYATGVYIEGRLYINGSVSFYLVRGTECEDVIRKLADYCREEFSPAFSARHGDEPSRSFQFCQLPDLEDTTND